MPSLKLKDLYFGNIDAKNELLMNSPEERGQFLEGFCLPPNIIVDQFLNRKRFFVTGLKGIGKTALLRYIAIKSELELSSFTSFILFKSQFSEEDKKDFAKAARTTIIENNVNDFQGSDYEVVWRWFIHRHIVDLIINNDLPFFQRDDAWFRYSACVRAPKLGDEDAGIKRLIPRLKKGTLEVSANPKLGLEFDWEDSNRSRVRFSNLAKQADDLFTKLIPGEGSLNIFIDELELNIGHKKQYERDALLIRDLIIALEKLNALCKKKYFNLGIYGAIRSEVLSAIMSTGKEINKIISDFGSKIVWNKPGGDIDNHPLLDIIVKRLRASEKKYGLKLDNDAESIWQRYFPKMIQSSSSQRYILHQTWYRPRDIIRLLNIARDQFPESHTFTHNVFDAIRKEYSSESWVELTEELSARYTKDELEAIRQIFIGYRNYFTIYELQDHIQKRAQIYPLIDVFMQRHKVGSLITDLYKIGMVGNVIEQKMREGKKELIRFSFRGDQDVILEEKLMVHNALKGFLTLIKDPR